MTGELAADLAGVVRGEVRFDAGARAAYSTDASNYRQVPIGVVLPESTVDIEAAMAVCRAHEAPVLSRGGGTSLAGQCCNEAVVFDLSKYCREVVSVDPQRKTAVVQAGAVRDDVDRELAAHDLMIGPKPATHASCTIGGMIGNNACGSTAQAYGKMADSVLRLEILTYDGLRTWVGPTTDEEYQRIVRAGGRCAELYRGLRELRDRHLAAIRTGYPDIPRRVSGYNLDALLPENGFDVAKALVGSESTLVTVLHAELRLFTVRPCRSLVVLGFPDIAAAADAVPAVAAHEPVALEGLDRTLVDLERSQHIAGKAIESLPKGAGWLLVQFAGDDQDKVHGQAQALVDELCRDDHGLHAAVLDDPEREDELWRAREAGLGATAYPPHEQETHEGWEDAAVPPDRLGDYLRDFRSLLDKFGYQGASLYGHFGHGCVHTRIPFDLRTAEGIAHYRDFVQRSADLVVSYGGSLSGEHGDGQARGELLDRMFSPELMRAFGELKSLWDKDNRMNPGKVVDPLPLDSRLREGVSYRPAEPPVFFSYADDEHHFSHAAARCVGVGNCRGSRGGVMCPSYRVTHAEEHSTRGRARLLFEMLRGEVVDGWRSAEVRDALDLCLSCKGCLSDCPVNVDMATYKAEFLAHHYAHRPRPRAHYSMGWLPALARLATLAPGVVNAVARAPGAKWLAGVDRRRALPVFARRRFTDTFRPDNAAGPAGSVLLLPDTFTNNFHPSIAHDAVKVLREAGFAVTVPRRTVCCGLTWISTGQLRTAKRVLRRTVRELEPQLRAGTPVVVLEPSCATVFRRELPDLLRDDEDAHRLAKQTRTLAEQLSDWTPPRLGGHAVAQVHCHQHAVLGFDADTELIRRAGVELDVLDAGCCGMAGNFGFERGHYEVSQAVAEYDLLPRLRECSPDTILLADGFSCRTQIEQSTVDSRPDAAPRHLAQLLAKGL